MSDLVFLCFVTEEKPQNARRGERNAWKMRRTEHPSGDVAWPARDLYLAETRDIFKGMRFV